jgi:hypothetical protein
MPRKNLGLMADGSKKKVKIDLTQNGAVDLAMKIESEKRLYKLRIDSKTVILVPKEKCNPDYAKEFQEKRDFIQQKLSQRGAAGGINSRKYGLR